MPREAGERWLKYFREELPTVAFKCSTQQQATNLGQKRGRVKAKAAPLGKGKAAKVGPGARDAALGKGSSVEDMLQVGPLLRLLYTVVA